MKSHLDLYGWEVRRVKRLFTDEPWFHLWLRGGIFPAAGGPLSHIARALEKFLR